MGQPTPHPPALLVVGVTSRHTGALDWAQSRAEDVWGPIVLASPRFDFGETDYYRATMGDELKKMFVVMSPQFDPAGLAEVKLATNEWERAYATLAKHVEPRPLNLDPGYLTRAKLVLASTKDHAHRVYLGKGIYAEVTLYYAHRAWQAREWTYPDYRRPDFQAFFSAAREVVGSRPAGGHES